MASGTIPKMLSLGTKQTITVPFSCTTDGFLQVWIRADVAGRVALENNVCLVDGYTVAAGYITGEFAVANGTTISAPTGTVNLRSVNYYWTPLT